ncbi:unnamed protein product [Boreogadus saida]
MRTSSEAFVSGKMDPARESSTSVSEVTGREASQCGGAKVDTWFLRIRDLHLRSTAPLPPPLPDSGACTGFRRGLKCTVGDAVYKRPRMIHVFPRLRRVT